MVGLDTLSNLEWVLSEHLRVHVVGDIIVIPFDTMNVFGFTHVLDGHGVAVLQTPIADDLQPSPALYRWVATKGDLVIGSLFASVNDDGLVDVNLRQTAYLDALTPEAGLEIVNWLLASGERLRGDARDLFS